MKNSIMSKWIYILNKNRIMSNWIFIYIDKKIK